MLKLFTCDGCGNGYPRQMLKLVLQQKQYLCPKCREQNEREQQLGKETLLRGLEVLAVA
jgi:hypothetical protein